MKKILYFILGSLVLIFIILMYSRFIGTASLKTNEIVINTNILESYDGLKIVHFTDLHYKKVITEERVKNLIKEINNTKPDIVIFTGDLLDNAYKMTNTDTNFLIEELNNIEAKYGKYAIMGDQDYQQKETILNIFIQSNFTLLNNTSTTIYNEDNDKISLIGMGSYLENDFNIEELKIKDDSIYKIVLIHEPDMITKIKNTLPNTSIILAGHSLNGSINIPIIKNYLLPNGAKNYYNTSYTIDNTLIYISNGIGVNNVNFRLFNTPSFNLYRLNKIS